ncbi:retropepsin-like aspartic protease, partial [Arcobacter sp. F2176]|uniref:retropepsin-like aspartic protease n=1 Tax=Arcobacter sp. F2176 TaxID=2044511 RepID=UPI001026F3BF
YLTYDYGNSKALYYLAQIYFNENEYFKAIKLLYSLKESAIEEDLQNKINKKIIKYTTEYLRLLNERKDLQTINTLLKYLIIQEPDSIKYKYLLAQYYFDNKTYRKSKELFEQIINNETYKNSTIEYLNKIESILKLQNKFTHKINLQKQKNHFFIDAFVDNKKLKLMIDTGATYTLINESNYSNYEKTKPIILNTANGQKEAYVAKVKEFRIDNIKIENFDITVSNFEDNDFDGLLGMNFLRQFDFYIDQEASILYLK